MPKSSERQLIQARKEKAMGLKNVLDEAQDRVLQLDEAQSHIMGSVFIGKTIIHKMFGKGIITSIENGRFSIDFGEKGTKELGINMCFANGLITVDGLSISEEQACLLKDENKIRNAETYAQKALAPYLEYLD